MLIPKVLCVVGPTSSGKTALSLELAKKYNGEIVNADARQIYRGFVIGTGQPTQEEQQDMPHHLFGFLEPERVYSVAEWKEAVLNVVHEITARSKLPILVGGTGLYIQALVDNFEPPSVPPQPELRAELEQQTLEQLVQRLAKEDPDTITWVDLKNRRRVERALEVVLTTGKSFKEQRGKGEPRVQAELIAIKRTPEALRARINAAIDQMLARGWKSEVAQLHAAGVAWETPAMTSIGYRELGAVLRGEMDESTAVEQIRNATWQYAKRQMTWFKRDSRIHWYETSEQVARRVGMPSAQGS